MLKKILLLVLVVVTMFVGVFAESDVNVVWDQGNFKFDVSPQIIEGRTMVPVRAIFESFGYNISWDDSTRTVTATKGNQKMILVIDEKLIKIVRNDKTYVKGLDVPAKIINNRTMIPLRIVSDVAGVQVDWDAEARTVKLLGSTNLNINLLNLNFLDVRDDFDIKQLSYGFEMSFRDMLILYGENFTKSSGVYMEKTDKTGTKFTYDINGYELSYTYKNENPKSDEFAVACFISGIPEGYRCYEVNNTTTGVEALKLFTENYEKPTSVSGTSDNDEYVIQYLIEYDHVDYVQVFNMTFDNKNAVQPNIYFYSYMRK